MKKIVLLLSIIFLGCQDDTQRTKLQNALNFEKELTQSFVIMADSIITIEGKKGIKITLNKEDLDGEISDSLKINLIELFDANDFLMANASTVSNGKWLISAGALKIDIYGKTPLKLKDGRTIKIDNINLQDDDYYTIVLKPSYIIDKALTDQNNGIRVFRQIIEIDSMGVLPMQLVKRKMSIDNIIIDNDTIRLFQKYDYSETDVLADEEAPSEMISLTKKQADTTINNFEIKNRLFNAFNIVENKIFKDIESQNLGWINVDKFAPDEEKVEVELKNIITNSRSYIIDKKNKTVLSFYEKKINLPINRRFQIISFGVKDNKFHVFKKNVRYSSNGELNMVYRKIQKNQIKDFLKLD